jgi:hypothetical protein
MMSLLAGAKESGNPEENTDELPNSEKEFERERVRSSENSFDSGVKFFHGFCPIPPLAMWKCSSL